MERRLVRLAVERNLTIIGEAVNRLRRYDPAMAFRLTGLSQIVGMRNILSHEYGSIDYETIWRTTQTSVPQLLAEVDALVREGSAGQPEPPSSF